MQYREYKLRVPISDISDEVGDVTQIRLLFSLLTITPPDISLWSMYQSFYDYSAGQLTGPWGRIGRGDVLIFVSDLDENSLLAFDMFLEATDQMNTIEIAVCAKLSLADKIDAVLRTIRSTAEVYCALLSGNLGIREALSKDRFPRLVPNLGEVVRQHAQYFRHGYVIYTSTG